MAETTLDGLQELQAAMDQVQAALQPDNVLGRGIQTATRKLYDHARRVTHRETGTLAAAHRWAFLEQGGGPRGVVFLEPGVRNVRSGAPVGRYGPIEHARGGDHAFYGRTIAEAGDQAIDAGLDVILSKLP